MMKDDQPDPLYSQIYTRWPSTILLGTVLIMNTSKYELLHINSFSDEKKIFFFFFLRSHQLSVFKFLMLYMSFMINSLLLPTIIECFIFIYIMIMYSFRIIQYTLYVMQFIYMLREIIRFNEHFVHIYGYVNTKHSWT